MREFLPRRSSGRQTNITIVVSSAGGLNYVGLILSGTALLSFAAILYSGHSSEAAPPAVPEPVPAG